MKILHLVNPQEIKPPFSREIKEMLFIERQHSINLVGRGVGYILGEYVLAPFFYKKDMIAEKDNQNIVLTFRETNDWGVSVFNLPFPIVCEPLSFRRERIHQHSFIFKVSDDVQLCRPQEIQKKKGKFEVNVPADFCPVFDRHSHLLGFNVGLFEGKWIMIDIKELI